MPAYLVEAPQRLGGRAAVVFAENAAYARSLSSAIYRGGADAMWDEATVTEIAEAADLEGWAMRVSVEGAAAQTQPIDFSVVAAADDVLDDLGGDMATALDDAEDIANAAYDSDTNILTVAGAGDGLGDGKVKVSLTPPGAARGSVGAYIGTITDGGDAGDALTVALAADAIALGAIYGEFRSL